LSAALFGFADFVTPEKLTVFNINEINKNNFIVYSKSDSGIFDYIPAMKSFEFLNHSSESKSCGGDDIYTANLFGIIPIKKVQINIFPQTSLIPGGMPFGVKFFTDGVVVVGLSDIETDKGTVNPAKNAGIKTSDIITEINGVSVNSVEETAKIIESSNGETLNLTVSRDGKSLEIKLKPVYSVSESKYKSGIWLRDSTAGIGTVTFISPANYAFGGLGHGICDVDTGNLMPLKKGTIINAVIDSAVKGKPELPGELKGKFKENMGTLLSNTQNGIFGIFNNMPVTPENVTPLPIGLRSDIKEGKAVIYSTVDDRGTREFDIEIIKIYKNSTDAKNFLVKITDPELLEITGGIVQGMSGSPIIQNGKLIGAVTHVLVSDPTKGYGIFMENMFSSMPELLK
jgi:stage IV sporulation protein B